MLRTLFIVFLFFLTACASNPPEYFSDGAWPVDEDQAYFRDHAASALHKMREPSLAAPQIAPAYRMLILAGGSPVHAVRVTPKDDGTAQVVINRLDAGYRKIGGRKHDSRKMRPASKTEYSTFLTALEDKPVFYQNAMPNLEDFHLCLHPSFYIYEIMPQTTRKLILENGCALTEEGLAVMKAFYAIADITPEKDADWSLVTW